MGWWDGLSRVARPPGGYCAADSALRLGVAVCRGDRLASWRTKRNCRHRAGQGVVEVVQSNRPGVWTAEGVTEEDFRVRAQGLESTRHDVLTGRAAHRNAVHSSGRYVLRRLDSSQAAQN